MKKETIEKVSQEVGLKGKRAERFVWFFGKRFPDESDSILSYVTEWANRFKDDPVQYMDKQSKDIYYQWMDIEIANAENGVALLDEDSESVTIHISEE